VSADETLAQKYPVFALVSRCVTSFGAGRRPCPGEGFRAVFGQIFGGFSGSAEDENRGRRKALALFAPMPIHSSPQCELPQGFAGFGN